MSEYTERVIEPVRTKSTTGPKGIVFRDYETGEEFRVYADDLLTMLEGTAFTVTAKIIPGGQGLRALRIKN